MFENLNKVVKSDEIILSIYNNLLYFDLYLIHYKPKILEYLVKGNYSIIKTNSEHNKNPFKYLIIINLIYFYFNF